MENNRDWVLTLKYLKPGVENKYDYLMATAQGDAFFWYTPNYQGVFRGAATRPFRLGDLEWLLSEGAARVVRARPGGLARIGLRSPRRSRTKKN